VNILGAHLGAALCDVAEAEAELVLQEPRAGDAIQGMHFERGDPDEEARASELLLLSMVPQDVTNVLAKEAFDALSELLHPVEVRLRHLPLNSRTRPEGRDLLVHSVVPRDIRDEVLDHRKCLQGRDRDWFVQRERIEPRLARQARPSVDLRRTGAALARLAIPADGEIGREVSLYVMERVQDHHAGRDRHTVLDCLPPLRASAKDFENRFAHAGFSKRAFRSAGISGTGDCESLIASPSREITLFFFPQAASVFG